MREPLKLYLHQINTHSSERHEGDIVPEKGLLYESVTAVSVDLVLKSTEKPIELRYGIY